MDDDGKIQDRGPADMSTQEERKPIAQIEERLRRLKVPETVIAKHVEQLERLRQPGTGRCDLQQAGGLSTTPIRGGHRGGRRKYPFLRLALGLSCVFAMSQLKRE